MNFLFWNIHKKNSFFNTIADIVREEDIDVMAFAEFPVGDELAFEALLKGHDTSFAYLAPNRKGKIELYYKDGRVNLDNAYDGARVSAKTIKSEVNGLTYQLVFCHIWDRWNMPENQQNYLVPDVVDEIKDFEKNSQNTLTLVCGDFNMDAYSEGMLLHNGFNAMMTSNIAKEKTRRVNKKDYDMFYNPMWGLYGDVHGHDAAGTYYIRDYKPVHQYWHIVDQVIMRPDVIDVFEKDSLKIVAKGHTYNLLNSKGTINNIDYSDHLPIKFKLNI